MAYKRPFTVVVTEDGDKKYPKFFKVNAMSKRAAENSITDYIESDEMGTSFRGEIEMEAKEYENGDSVDFDLTN